ncbi:conserved exported hypothetical protein [Tenacibaculum halocynthiae]|uniref:lipocalin family protein n=2 Tax=Flavobacteriaceae TaxID=49546 RepID=UPI000B86E98E|nr:lipocalin family protein [uncultured Tenacibaculum sp.]RBW62952.1 hypothetical protein DS884_01150 [Tenacibaculum sp. E3R01]
MKKMKLFYRLLIIFIIFSSCTSDENSNSGSVSIIGDWKITKKAYSCSSKTIQDLGLNQCEKKITISILENGNIILNDFRFYNNDCVLKSTKGNWKLNNNELVITLENADDFTFTEFKNNILKIGYYSTDPTKICDDTSQVSYSYVEFVKL